MQNRTIALATNWNKITWIWNTKQQKMNQNIKTKQKLTMTKAHNKITQT